MKQRHKPTNARRIISQDEAAIAERFQEELMENQAEMSRPGMGRLFAADVAFEQELEFVSDAVDKAGNDFQLYLGRISRSPVVKNPRTGRYFILPWADVISLAEAAGLNR